MPRCNREWADQIILKLREAELERSRGKTVPEAHRTECVTERGCAEVCDRQYEEKESPAFAEPLFFQPFHPHTAAGNRSKRGRPQTA